MSFRSLIHSPVATSFTARRPPPQVKQEHVKCCDVLPSRGPRSHSYLLFPHPSPSTNMGTGNVAASYFLGVMFMSSFYSLYLVAFVASVYFSFNVRGRRVRPNKVILSASIVLFIIINVVRGARSPVLALLLTGCAALRSEPDLQLSCFRRAWRDRKRRAQLLQQPTCHRGTHSAFSIGLRAHGRVSGRATVHL
jgi:hypothetical protein